LPSSWQPILADGPAPLFERVLGALAADIETGKLPPGTRLPPQRELALSAGISLGTVTRAYAEAERRGLVTAHVGRGSYVAGAVAANSPVAANDGPIDLCHNIPPHGPARAEIKRLSLALAADGTFAQLLDYTPVFGIEDHRRAVGEWLVAHAQMPKAHAPEVVLCGGTQQAMALALGSVCKPGDIVLCEELTFYGMRALADYAGYRLHGVSMDHLGLCPDALEKAIRQTGARVLYVLPTLQNPTARMMDLGRRQAIVDVARRHDLWLIEDDVYGYFAKSQQDYVPLSVLAAERSFYLGGLSKVLAPGLRVGFALPPVGGQHNDLMARQLRATTYTSNGFGSAIIAHAIRSGLAEQIANNVRQAARDRLSLAHELLGPAIEPPPVDCSLHVWVPLSELSAERIAGRALRQGVEVTPPGAANVGTGPSGLRLCLGGAADLGQLRRGLGVIAAALAQSDERAASSIV
jgi:DNA-binding transcriptional MocR family regulator